ncbi:MAG: ACT domain-containing protein, partial [Abditibacteriota bacterium]|nr:ACT domain-containing protein [Abditibacteriota bacterium]
REDHEMNSQNAEMEIRNPVRGIAHDTDVTRITIVGVPDKPGVAAKLFKALSDAGISVDVIVQNVSVAGKTDLSFTVADEDLEKTKKIIAPIYKDIEAADVITDSVLAKVSVVGSGMKTSPGYASTMFAALAAEGINIYSITTSEIRITCLVERDKIKAAVRALHKAFELEKA